MLEILASVCLLDEPARCKEVHLSYAEQAERVTPQQCFYYGQIELSKWVEGNPKWRIAKWSCGQARDIAGI